MNETKLWLKNNISYLYTVTITIFIAIYIYNNHSKYYEILKTNPIDKNFLLLSSLSMIVLVSLLAIGWRYIFYQLSSNLLSIKDALQIHYQATISKYMPGKVGVVLVKIFILKKRGGDGKIILLSCLYENMFMIIGGILISIPFCLNQNYFNSNQLNYWIFAIFVGTGALYCLYPSLLYRSMNIVFKFLKKSQIPKELYLKPLTSLAIISSYALLFILQGLSLYYVIISILPLNGLNILDLTGLYVLSGLAGFFVFFSPAGIGIREGVLVLFLSKYYSLEEAVLIATLARITAFLADMSILALTLAIVKNKYIPTEELTESKL